MDLGTRINQREKRFRVGCLRERQTHRPSFSKDSGDTDAIIIERILLVRSIQGSNARRRGKASLQSDLSTAIVLIEADSAEKLYDFPVVWKFRQGSANEGEAAKWFDAKPDKRLEATSGPTQAGEPGTGQDHRGTAWYSVAFTAPPLPEKTVGVDLLAADLRKLFLRFGAVDGQCWVWLDGKPVGSQIKPAATMWDKPFAIDLGSVLVKPGQSASPRGEGP